MRKVFAAGEVRWIERKNQKTADYPEYLSREVTESVREFHQSLPLYAKTPLVSLPALADFLQVGHILVKDESKRFGLNAFKGLGGAYALAMRVCEKLGKNAQAITLSDLQSEEMRKEISAMTFITTTDGNHGKGISWAAALLGAEARVYMPRGSAQARARAIEEAGNARVLITDMGYDDTVRYTARLAKEKGWELIQDTSWPGYENVPRWIVQGYTTMLYEAIDEMEEKGIFPTHVFLQAGVGAMAGGVLGAIAVTYREKMPRVFLVEPEEVACIFESARQDDGFPHPATGSEITIMAGLNCAEPCQLTWPILRDFADIYCACSDKVAVRGMQKLARPMGTDMPIVSGESGAVTAGLLSLLGNEEYSALRKTMGLDQNSVVLLFSTEGDTDPEMYKKIVESAEITE